MEQWKEEKKMKEEVMEGCRRKETDGQNGGER